MYNKLANKLSKKRLASKFFLDLKIFRDTSLSPLEAVVKFLKDSEGLSYRKIGLILGRDERNIWTVYNRARRKLSLEKKPWKENEKQ
jgi:hypothetical protein